jgi:micrococcal nuclease
MLLPRLLFIALVLLPFVAWADFSGKVVSVMDGDTIAVMHNGQAERIRLFGIDAPEKGQAFGQRSKQFASGAAFGKTVTIVEHGMDKYGRTLGDVILPDGSNLNQELVRVGLAWWW